MLRRGSCFRALFFDRCNCSASRQHRRSVLRNPHDQSISVVLELHREPQLVYETYYNAGSISLNLDGTHWAGGSLYIEVSYQPGLAQWAGSTASGDGISIILRWIDPLDVDPSARPVELPSPARGEADFFPCPGRQW